MRMRGRLIDRRNSGWMAELTRWTRWTGWTKEAGYVGKTGASLKASFCFCFSACSRRTRSSWLLLQVISSNEAPFRSDGNNWIQPERDASNLARLIITTITQLVAAWQTIFVTSALFRSLLTLYCTSFNYRVDYCGLCRSLSRSRSIGRE